MDDPEAIDLYGDEIGKVEYVSHMGNDLTVVNSARVSFGRHKEELDDREAIYKFQSYTKKLDINRKQHIVNYIPELEEFVYGK